MTVGVFRPAGPADLDRLLALQTAYYAEDGYPHRPAAAAEAWALVLGTPALGRVWLATAGDEAAAYVVLALGFSLEYLGRDAFVDELYVAPPWRGQGLGRAALAVVEEACRELGVRALHLEVERDKPAATALYRQSGFRAHDRVLMTRLL
ncbi:MAG: GNAT family N-acetyltransferase [Vicinamibacterales bacterium]